MRKKEKDQILEIIGTLGEAHKMIRDYISNNDFQNAYILLCDCQQTALNIGEFIEKVEGVECASVKMLEKYCEKLYQIGECISENISAQDVYNLLNENLIQIENSINIDISVRLEILFLPYKASMWDSLESIWRAADADPNSDAYVMPIPYYDKTQNGSFHGLHYEGEQYPDYVPTVHYDAYDIEKRRPDIIFVHSPYDNDNYITSVHPNFYCKKLRNMTDLLVYVPYFVNLYDVPEHFCVCAGTLHSDLVVTQSEVVRETYIRVFKQMEIEHNCQNYFGNPDEKFIALGSPKIDKALSIATEDIKLPTNWERFFIKSNGKPKKVVLLNTTIIYMLKYEKSYLDHLREVFDVFKEHDDILLWWRPHPLSDTTISSMRQDLYMEYQELIEYYKTNQIGIYDDSADLHRAIAVCDACYGDNSSVLVLVWAAQKPIMLRNTVKSFSASISNEGNFMDGINQSKDGIKKILLFETQKYSLEHFLYDIQDETRYREIKQYQQSCFDDAGYVNFGHAGQEIYDVAKTRLIGRR